MMILKQDRTGIIDSKKYTIETNANNELFAVPNDGGQNILIGKFSTANGAKRCITNFFDALANGKEYFKVPYSVWKKTTQN